MLLRNFQFFSLDSIFSKILCKFEESPVKTISYRPIVSIIMHSTPSHNKFGQVNPNIIHVNELDCVTKVTSFTAKLKVF